MCLSDLASAMIIHPLNLRINLAKNRSCISLALDGFYVAFNTVQVISQQVVGRAEETSTYSSLGFCTVNCRAAASNYQLSHLRLCGDRTPASEVGGESVATLPPWPLAGHLKKRSQVLETCSQDIRNI